MCDNCGTIPKFFNQFIKTTNFAQKLPGPFDHRPPNTQTRNMFRNVKKELPNELNKK